MFGNAASSILPRIEMSFTHVNIQKLGNIFSTGTKEINSG
jgi:hypothetical protein